MRFSSDIISSGPRSSPSLSQPDHSEIISEENFKLKEEQREILHEMENLKEEERKILEKIEMLKKEINQENEALHEKEKEKFNLRVRQQELSLPWDFYLLKKKIYQKKKKLLRMK